MTLYKSHALDESYSFHGDRLTEHGIRRVDEYVRKNVGYYEVEHQDAADVERLSEYFPYKYIESQMVPANQTRLSICNIGCFYCGADYQFLTKHPDSTVYGLDFGSIRQINANLAHPNLKLYEGYPLDTLENMLKDAEDPAEPLFDYAIFTRTATLINIEQLRTYMRCLGKLARNVIFLEVAKLTAFATTRNLDVNGIDMLNPVRMYGGMYLHNYPKVLEDAGFALVEASVLPYDTFNQFFTKDHDFVFVHGRNTKLKGVD